MGSALVTVWKCANTSTEIGHAPPSFGYTFEKCKYPKDFGTIVSGEISYNNTSYRPGINVGRLADNDPKFRTGENLIPARVWPATKAIRMNTFCVYLNLRDCL